MSAYNVTITFCSANVYVGLRKSFNLILSDYMSICSYTLMVTNHRYITTIDFVGFKFHLAKYVQGWFLNSFTSFIDVAHFIGKLSKNTNSFTRKTVNIIQLKKKLKNRHFNVYLSKQARQIHNQTT